MTVYISIPISGKDINRQREHADRMKAALSRAGHKPVNPFENYCGENPTYADYLCYDLRILADCEAIMLCEDWQFSRGCRIERTFAEEFGLQIMYERQEASDGSEYYYNK